MRGRRLIADMRGIFGFASRKALFTESGVVCVIRSCGFSLSFFPLFLRFPLRCDSDFRRALH